LNQLIVVSNTSPIINLAAIGHLDLLPRIYRTIAIPQAVYEEITVAGQGKPGDQEVQEANWITVYQVTNTKQVVGLCQSLNLGEAEAIALTLQLGAKRLLIDEHRGREIASNYGITITGILGILTIARRQNFIHQVRPVLDQLRDAGFWIAQPLYDRVLQTVGEGRRETT
jgi:hypothetical protein